MYNITFTKGLMLTLVPIPKTASFGGLSKLLSENVTADIRSGLSFSFKCFLDVIVVSYLESREDESSKRGMKYRNKIFISMNYN